MSPLDRPTVRPHVLPSPSAARLMATIALATSAAVLPAQQGPILAEEPTRERSLAPFVKRSMLRYRGSPAGTASMDHDGTMSGLRLVISDQEGAKGILALATLPAHTNGSGSRVSLVDFEASAVQDFVPIGDGRRTLLAIAGTLGLAYRRARVVPASGEPMSFDLGRAILGVGPSLMSRVRPMTIIDVQTMLLGAIPLHKHDNYTLPPGDLAWHSEVAIHWERALGDKYGVTLGATHRRDRRHDAVGKLFPGSGRVYLPYRSVETALRLGVHW